MLLKDAGQDEQLPEPNISTEIIRTVKVLAGPSSKGSDFIDLTETVSIEALKLIADPTTRKLEPHIHHGNDVNETQHLS